MAEQRTTDFASRRRPILKGIGAGAVMPLLGSGVGVAKQRDEQSQNIDVAVAPWDEGEDRAIQDIDTDDTFSARINISGIEPPKQIAYMVAPFNSEDQFGGQERVHAQSHEITSNPEVIVHSSFNPGGFLHEWAEGDYRLITTVVDGSLELVGTAASDTFRIE